MSSDIGKKDLRIIKTEKALNDAMYTLLTYQTFRKITVRDICEEALVSRATFYSYYIDKYDLLRYWLSTVTPHDLGRDPRYETLANSINQFFMNYKIAIKNILEDADSETMGIAMDCVLSLLEVQADKSRNGKQESKYIVVSNFLAGGIIQYLLWHVKNKFPTEVMNTALYSMAHDIIEKYQNGEL